MKKLTLLTLSLVTLSAPAMAASSAMINVNGLVCDFCARALEKVFGKQEAVSDIDVNLDTKIITVNFKDGQNLSNDALTALITDSGYNVEGISRDE